MKKLITIAAILSFSGSVFANSEIDYVHSSFQWDEGKSAINENSNFSAGHPGIDYVHLSFQEDSQGLNGVTALASTTGSQPEIGSAEIDYLNDSFQLDY